MLIVSALSALVLTGAGPTAGAPEPVDAADRTRALAELPASDTDIERALFDMLKRDPERVVCSVRTYTGSRQPRTSCATLRAWFNNRRPGEIRNGDAPWQLVEEIKEQRKKALMRNRSGG